MWQRKIVKKKAKARLGVDYWKIFPVGLLMTLSFFASLIGVLYSINAQRAVKLRYFAQEEVELDERMMVVAVTMLCICTMALILSFLSAFFVFHPLKVGCKKFFYSSITGTAEKKELMVGFHKDYLNIFKILFFRDLSVFLWSLLFIIPGIVKAYEYRMIPYLLAEKPDMSKEDAFAISRRMMDGNKGKAFVFDLPFLVWWLAPSTAIHLLFWLFGWLFGWLLLPVMILWIAINLFYVNPYYFQTDAMLYDAIKIDDQNRYGADHMQFQTFINKNI